MPAGIDIVPGLGTLTASGVDRGMAFRLTLPVGGTGGRAHAASAAMGPAGREPSPASPGTVLAWLDGGGAVCREAAAGMREAVREPEALDALEGPGACAWTGEHLDYYSSRSSRAGARRGMARAHPVLRLVLPRLLPPSAAAQPDATDLDPLKALASAVDAAFPGCADRASLARALAAGIAFESLGEVAAAASLPPEWLPAAGEERRAFGDVVSASERLARRLGGHAFLLASRGRWAEFMSRLEARVPPSPGSPGPAERLAGACGDACGMADAFVDQAFLPALMNGHPRMRAALAEREEGTRRAGATALFGGKGLTAIVDLAGEWRSGRATIDAAMASLGWWSGLRWPVPLGPQAAPNGISIVFLGDDASLAAEGARGVAGGAEGLDHCVGGYAGKVASGASAVASVRRPGPPGTFTRLSTVELVLAPGRAQVVQHCGRRNWDPPPDAVAAVDWLVREVSSGRVVPAPMAGAGEGWDLGAACRIDPDSRAAVDGAVAAWSPYLRRPLRSAPGLASSMEVLDLLLSGAGRPAPAGAHRAPQAGSVAAEAAVPGRLLGILLPGRSVGAGRDVADAVVSAYAMLALTWLPAVAWMAPAADLVPARDRSRLPESVRHASLPAAAVALWPGIGPLGLPAAVAAALALPAGAGAAWAVRAAGGGQGWALAVAAWMAAGAAYYASAAGVAGQVLSAWRARSAAEALRGRLRGGGAKPRP